METQIKAWCYDMLVAIHEIEVFLEDVPDFESYTPLVRSLPKGIAPLVSRTGREDSPNQPSIFFGANIE